MLTASYNQRSIIPTMPEQHDDNYAGHTLCYRRPVSPSLPQSLYLPELLSLCSQVSQQGILSSSSLRSTTTKTVNSTRFIRCFYDTNRINQKTKSSPLDASTVPAPELTCRYAEASAFPRTRIDIG